MEEKLITLTKNELRELLEKSIKEHIKNSPVKPGVIYLLTGRIPDPFLKFHTYLKGNMKYMQAVDPVTGTTNGARLGISPADINLMPAMELEWDNPDPNNPGIFQLHGDPNTKNKVTRTKYEVFVKKFNDWYHPVLDIVAASPAITDLDRLVTNVSEVPATHHVSTTPIPETPTIEAKGAGIGKVEIKARITSSSGRAALPENCDELEIRCAPVGKAASLSGPETTPILKETAPANPDQCTKTEFGSKSIHVINIGGLYSGFELHGWVRYSYSKHRDLGIQGNWSEKFIIRIP